MYCGWSSVIKVSVRNMHFVFNLNHAEEWRVQRNNIYTTYTVLWINEKMRIGMKCVRNGHTLYSIVWLWVCSLHTPRPFLHFCIAVCIHTYICVYVSQIMHVCLVDSMSGLCPLGRPCVAQFCSNRFWQLCNFCWFLPDLGKLSFCSAGVICKAYTV